MSLESLVAARPETNRPAQAEKRLVSRNVMSRKTIANPCTQRSLTDTKYFWNPAKGTPNLVWLSRGVSLAPAIELWYLSRSRRCQLALTNSSKHRR